MTPLQKLLSNVPGFEVRAAPEPGLANKTSLERLRLDPKLLVKVPDSDLYDYKGDVNWNGLGLKTLPRLFRNVLGNFEVSNNQLESLEGSPAYVRKDYKCICNHLTSLDGVSPRIGGSLNIHGNHIAGKLRKPAGVRGVFFVGEQYQRATAARPANTNDPHPVREYINAIKTGLTRKEITVAPGVTLHFRTVAALTKTPGEYTLKFTFQHNHDEIPDLELVMYTGLDDMIGLFQTRKIRTVSKEKAYKHTAKDEAAVLSSDPHTVCEDIKHKLSVNGDLNRLVVDLYKQAIRHLADRHVENEVETPEHLSPFDYGMELRRAFGNNPVHVDADVTLVLDEVTSLKVDDDVVVKFKPAMRELPQHVEDLELLLYLTTDKLTDGVGIRKVRFRSKKQDYSDSDTTYWNSLNRDPAEAARDLRHDLEHGPTGDLVREMALRARYQLAGGDPAELGWRDSNNPGHFADPEDDKPSVQTIEDDNRGSGIDWNELGFEDPGL